MDYLSTGKQTWNILASNPIINLDRTEWKPMN